jgi:hypothetical protein
MFSDALLCLSFKDHFVIPWRSSRKGGSLLDADFRQHSLFQKLVDCGGFATVSHSCVP